MEGSFHFLRQTNAAVQAYHQCLISERIQTRHPIQLEAFPIEFLDEVRAFAASMNIPSAGQLHSVLAGNSLA